MAEPELGQLVHAVVVQARFQHIGHQHGVLDRRHLHAVARQHGHVVLGVLRDLEDGGVLQQRLQPGDDHVERDLLDVRRRLQLQALAVLVADGNVAGLARRDGEGDPAQAGVGRGEGVGLGVEGDEAVRRRARDPAVQVRHVTHALIGLNVDRRLVRRPLGDWLGRIARLHHRGGGGAGRGRGRGGAGGRRAVPDAPRQGAELHLLQEVRQGRPVRVGHGQAVDRHGQGRVAGQLHQLARQPHLVGEIDQGLAALVLLDLAGARQEGVEVAVFVDQQGGGLDPDARRARHVVDAVAAQGLDVHHLLGRNAELLDHLLAPDADVLHGVEHGDAVADELHQVLVGGDDHHLAPGVAGGAGVGGDDVVGLVAVQLDRRHAEGAGGLAHQAELRDQILGRRRAVGLVLRVEVGAERLLRGVEYDRQVRRPLRVVAHLAQQLPQHVAEAGHRADRQAVGLPREGRQGVVGAEDVARPVHEVEAHRRPVLGRLARDLIEGDGGLGQVGVGHGGKIGQTAPRREAPDPAVRELLPSPWRGEGPGMGVGTLPKEAGP